MTGRLIIEIKFQIIENTFFNLNIPVTEQFSQTIDFGLIHLTVDDDDRITQISSFNQIIGQQHFHFPQKYKSTARGDLFRKISRSFRIRSELHRQIRRIVSYHGIDRIRIIRQ